MVQAALAAGQGEQRFDQPFLLLACGEHFLAGQAQGGGGGGGVCEGYLDHGAFEGERGAQLVGGVGDELPLGVEGGLQPGEQCVDGVGEVGELVGGARHGQPSAQVVFGDGPGGRGDLPAAAAGCARRAASPRPATLPR